MEKIKISSKGFTLLELLVVVLIIGILASIALPQYQMAVTKAKVASILPLMRRFKDALAEYKLQHGSYEDIEDTSVLGVSWPSDWNDGDCGESTVCQNNYWSSCGINDVITGTVFCYHEDENTAFFITMYQSDESEYEDLKGMTTCECEDTESEKICKALGGKLLEGVIGLNASIIYKLN